MSLEYSFVGKVRRKCFLVDNLSNRWAEMATMYTLSGKMSLNHSSLWKTLCKCFLVDSFYNCGETAEMMHAQLCKTSFQYLRLGMIHCNLLWVDKSPCDYLGNHPYQSYSKTLTDSNNTPVFHRHSI
jgi:hypothetical protein